MLKYGKISNRANTKKKAEAQASAAIFALGLVNESDFYRMIRNVQKPQECVGGFIALEDESN